MGGNPVITKIAGLLKSDTPDKQIAAAIVLAELRARDPLAIDGLLALVGSGVAPLQRHGLSALAAIGATKVLPHALALVAARDADVRAAAVDALASFGDAAVPLVREKLAAAAPQERRVYDEILGRLGGKDALSALLSGLAPDDFDTARNAVLPLRQRIKESDARGRKRYYEHAAGFLGSKAAATLPAARVAALKILGFTEDSAGLPTLVGFATDRKEHESVRQEALIAIRLVAHGGPAAAATAKDTARGKLDAKMGDKLLSVGETAPLAVARVALLSLLGAPLPPQRAPRLEKLAGHAEGERALLALDLLGQIPGDGAGDALGRILIATSERARAEAAATALGKRGDAGAALTRALLATVDKDRTQMLVSLLRPHLRGVDDKLKKKLIACAIERVAAGDSGAEPLLQLARSIDGATVAAGLRALADRLRKSKKPDLALPVLRILGRSSDATPDDGYALASMELTGGLRDQSFLIIGQLVDRGFDVGAAIRKDRALDHNHRYQVGFHFAERGHPLGEELLTAVAEAAGRTKVGQMARAKLKSSGF